MFRTKGLQGVAALDSQHTPCMELEERILGDRNVTGIFRALDTFVGRGGLQRRRRIHGFTHQKENRGLCFSITVPITGQQWTPTLTLKNAVANAYDLPYLPSKSCNTGTQSWPWHKGLDPSEKCAPQGRRHAFFPNPHIPCNCFR